MPALLHVVGKLVILFYKHYANQDFIQDSPEKGWIFFIFFGKKGEGIQLICKDMELKVANLLCLPPSASMFFYLGLFSVKLT